MFMQRNKIKSIINFFVIALVSIVGIIKVKTLLGYFVGVPSLTWLAYLLSNAMCTDLIFGEKYGAKDE